MKLFDVIGYKGEISKNWVIYKYPSEDITTLSQLVVREGQVAIFVNEGTIKKSFGPGTYTLNSNNLPFLKSIVKIPFGKKTPFVTEVFFVNNALIMDVAWGTPDSIQLVDPKYNIRIRVRAFGSVGVRVADAEVFLRQLIGAMQPSEIVNISKIQEYYRGLIVNKVKTLIAKVIIGEKVSALEISTDLEKLSNQIQEEAKSEFERYGLTITNFYLKSINFPDEDFEALNRILHDKAAFEIMGDSRYLAKRRLDVLETAAGNESGVSGSLVGAGVGLGAGMEIVKDFKNNISCPKCGFSMNPGMNFCPSCGTRLNNQPSVCSCGATLPEGSKFCPVCGKPNLK